MDQDSNTEDQIFEAAQSVFYEHGFDGARMQEISKRAGINQSMLHYYYRSKAKLFDAVFARAIASAMPPIIGIIKSDLPILEKIEHFVTSYVGMILKSQHIPAFILEELRRNPQRLEEVAGKHTGGAFAVFEKQVDEAGRQKVIRPTDAQHLFANMLSLCVFPVVARPMLRTVIGLTDKEYDVLLTERAKEITDFILNAVRI